MGWKADGRVPHCSHPLCTHIIDARVAVRACDSRSVHRASWICEMSRLGIEHAQPIQPTFVKVTHVVDTGSGLGPPEARCSLCSTSSDRFLRAMTVLASPIGAIACARSGDTILQVFDTVEAADGTSCHNGHQLHPQPIKLFVSRGARTATSVPISHHAALTAHSMNYS